MNEQDDAADGVDLGRLRDILGFRLKRVQNRLSRDFAGRSRKWNLRAGMFSALEIIAANPGISQGELSDAVGLDKSAMVQIIDDLEQRGWVLRTRSVSDRRRNDLSVTPVGQGELARMVEIMHAVEDSSLSVLTATEREQISSLLDKVYRGHRKGG